MSDYTSFLFARPSFLEGVARLLDVGGTLNEYNTSPNGRLADYNALRMDWKAVGDALRQAMAQYEVEQPELKQDVSR
jgi:hypothetical protein